MFILISFIVIMCHVGIDVGTNTTAPKILMERLGMGLDDAAFATSLYFIFRTAGCFSGSFILRKMNAKSFFAISSFMMLLAMIGLFVFHSKTSIYICIALIGYGNSNIFSIVFSQALLYMPGKKNEVSGLIGLFALGSIGFLYSSDYFFNKVLEPHQQIRIKVVLGMEEDLAGAGYNVNQSKIAIGSGGLTGKGFLNGTQTKLKYVPEQDTDFIFCTVGEEEGFVGSTAVLLLFLILILRLIAVAERQQSPFGRVYGYSVLSIFLFHLFINIGMVLGLTPVIGIPLPFFSYGGSSLWGFTILLFIFLRIDAGRNRRI